MAVLISSVSAQAPGWDKAGPGCGHWTTKACIVHTGDPTYRNNPTNVDGEACQASSETYTSKNARLFRARMLQCQIRVRVSDSCKVNGRSGAIEVGIQRRTTKTTPLGTPQTIGDVWFGEGCGVGAYGAGEIRIV